MMATVSRTTARWSGCRCMAPCLTAWPMNSQPASSIAWATRGYEWQTLALMAVVARSRAPSAPRRAARSPPASRIRARPSWARREWSPRPAARSDTAGRWPSRCPTPRRSRWSTPRCGPRGGASRVGGPRWRSSRSARAAVSRRVLLGRVGAAGYSTIAGREPRRRDRHPRPLLPGDLPPDHRRGRRALRRAGRPHQPAGPARPGRGGRRLSRSTRRTGISIGESARWTASGVDVHALSLTASHGLLRRQPGSALGWRAP